MSRHSGFPAGPGRPRVAADYNTFHSELVTKSAAIDYTNLAREGLDIRNFGENALFEMNTRAGARRHYVEVIGPATITGATAAYRGEAAAAFAIGGTPVELDWTPGYAVASDEVVEIKGTVTFGTSTAGGHSPGGSDVGVSAVVLLDVGAGYVVQANSRSGRFGRQQNMTAGAVANNVETIQMDTFDLTPTWYVTSGTIVKIALSVGTTLPLVADQFVIHSAQIQTAILKKVR